MTSNQKKYNSTNPLQMFLIKKFLQKIQELISKIEGKTLLDVGSGEGYVLKAILDQKQFQAAALEPNKKALKILQKKLPNIIVKQGYVENIPFDNNSFEVVVCCEVLEHLPDPEKALQELKRVGKKYFILSVPNEPWFSLANFLRGKNISRWGCDPEHIQKWSTKAFSELVNKELKIIKIQQSFPWTIVLAKK